VWTCVYVCIGAELPPVLHRLCVTLHSQQQKQQQRILTRSPTKLVSQQIMLAAARTLAVSTTPRCVAKTPFSVRCIPAVQRSMSTKVAVLGAAGGIGQALSLLLKTSPLVDELSCYDIVGTPGVAADLSHVR
jgi:hypothetical protein